jgi:hypothetical protein
MKKYAKQPRKAGNSALEITPRKGLHVMREREKSVRTAFGYCPRADKLIARSHSLSANPSRALASQRRSDRTAPAFFSPFGASMRSASVIPSGEFRHEFACLPPLPPSDRFIAF